MLSSLEDAMSQHPLVVYGFRLPKGDLARIVPYGNDAWQLSDDPQDPIFLTQDRQVIANTLFENVRSYNSDQERPNWGPFKREDLMPVCVRVNVECEPVDIKPVEDVGSWVVDTRDTRRSAKDPTKVVWVLVNGTMEQWVHAVGQKLAFGCIYNQRLVLEVREAEEEWADLCENKQGVIFICQRS